MFEPKLIIRESTAPPRKNRRRGETKIEPAAENGWLIFHWQPTFKQSRSAA